MSLSLMNGEREMWRALLPHVELLAGMLAIGTTILHPYPNYHLKTDTDCSSYRAAINIREEDIPIMTRSKLRTGFYICWLQMGNGNYALYQFKTSRFLQGVISMAHAFKVDFRMYLHGYPMDKQGRQYTLAGYRMVPYEKMAAPFDLNDIEMEEEGNENLLELIRSEYD